MKQKNALYIITAMMVMLLALSAISGCGKQPAKTQDQKNIETDHKDTKEEIPEAEKVGELIEKRGQQTDIKEFDELLRRASKIKSYKYRLSDTELDFEPMFYIKQRFIKVKLPSIREHATGEKYDEVLLDRKTKTALSHCSKDVCDDPLDKELEKVEYDEYYRLDPYEMLTRVTQAELVDEEMLGNDYTKVFSMKYDGKEGKVWIQEYYGYPIKFEIGNRVVEFKDMFIDATRSGEVEPPFDFSVKGEKGTWWTWQHYLGEMDGKDIPLQGIKKSA